MGVRKATRKQRMDQHDPARTSEKHWESLRGVWSFEVKLISQVVCFSPGCSAV